MPTIENNLIDSADLPAEVGYLMGERLSIQWRGFLRAFSAEINSQLTPVEFKELMRSMGTRMGESITIGEHDTVDALEAEINRHLKEIRWGYIRLSDAGNQLNIKHYLCPLASDLGLEPQVAAGFLEGMFEHWFHAAGAQPDLVVRQIVESSSLTALEFQLGRNV